MQKKKEDLLKKVLKKIISSFSTSEGEKLVELLYEKQNVNEFLIAKKLKLTINQTRNILYKLADEGLVGFIRKKDKKKGGWYTYFWTMRVKRSLLKYKEGILDEIEKLKNQLRIRETERHFICKNCDSEFNEENAMINDYTCPECGEVLQMRETTEITSKIKSEIKKLEDSLVNLNVEIGKIEELEEKSLGRKLKAEEKKKKQERLEKRLEREKEKKKLEKKSGKKEKKKIKKTAKKKTPPKKSSKKKKRK
jgi:transcription factor E